MTETNLEPTDDNIWDGTRLPTTDEMPDEEGDPEGGDD